MTLISDAINMEQLINGRKKTQNIQRFLTDIYFSMIKTRKIKNYNTKGKYVSNKITITIEKMTLQSNYMETITAED